MTRCCGHRLCDVVVWCGTHAAYTYPGRIQSRSCSWLRIASTSSCGCNHSTMRVLSLPMKGGHICTQVLNAFSRVSFIVFVTLAMRQVDAEVAILHFVQFFYHFPKLCVVAAEATAIALSNFLFVFSVCFVFQCVCESLFFVCV